MLLTGRLTVVPHHLIQTLASTLDESLVGSRRISEASVIILQTTGSPAHFYTSNSYDHGHSIQSLLASNPSFPSLYAITLDRHSVPPLHVVTLSRRSSPSRWTMHHHSVPPLLLLDTITLCHHCLPLGHGWMETL